MKFRNLLLPLVACVLLATCALYGVEPIDASALCLLGLRLPVKNPDPSGNMASNGKLTFLVPRGNALFDATFHFQTAGVDMTVAQMKSMCDTITWKVGGKAVREWTPTTLDIANATNGAIYAAANGYLTDYFAEPWRRTMEGEERGAWGTQGVGDITCEVKFNATAVTPTVEMHTRNAETDRPFRAYPVRHVRTYNIPVINGTTQWPGNGMLREIGLFYDRIHFQSALVSSVEIQVEKNPKWEDIPRALLATEWFPKQGLAMQTAVYSVAFSGMSRQLTDMLASFVTRDGKLDLASDFRVEITATGAANVDVFTEQYQVFK